MLSATSAGRWGTSPVTALVQFQIRATEGAIWVILAGVVVVVVVRLATLAVDMVSAFSIFA